MSEHKRNKKNKQTRTKFSVFLIIVAVLIIAWLAVGVFIFFNKAQQEPASIYVSSESAKQGDTIFVKVNSNAKDVVGNFGTEKLDFYKEENSTEWFSFLGIDADQKPGNYEINVDTSDAEHLAKEINVSLASFSSAPVVAAPASNKNGITNEKAVNNIRNNDNPVINKVLDNFTPQPYFTAPFSFPLSVMQIGGFSFGKFIGFGKYALQHLGVDLKAPEKTDIYAVNDGKVVATLNLSNYGKTIIIDHGMDIFSMYLHLDKFDVSDGEMVKRGQLIGLSGDTGYVTGPHLHFSMRVDGTRVDPIAFINTTQQISDNHISASVSGAFSNIFK